MPYAKVEKPEHYVVQLDDAGAVDVVTLRTVESVVDSVTGGAVSDTTAIVPIVNFSDRLDTPGAREGLVKLRSLIDAAIARLGSAT
ncbi:hypothetical protein [Burkholderia contaminans]|uniref:hypothetical protein n=1 Tax=Burkholderia contaminans TaxID=488447 RepID=UPI0014541B83|nr:hypothetical protein [Burkholderia contaminans]VWD22498.1 hypothetical protein BCO18442_04026 [Burkholderia contaminans]